MENNQEKVVETQTNEGIEMNEDNYLIDAEEFKKITLQPHISIVDFREKVKYNEEHIANAINIWRTDVEDQSYAYGGMMSTKGQIENLFGKLGIETDDTIVIYDDKGLCNASRLWWILQNYNFDNVKMFHGGIEAWKSVGGEMSNENTPVIETEFRLPENNDYKFYLSKEDMEKALSSKATIVDTRSIEEFSGKIQKKGAAKAGRIPNSVHMDWAEAVNYHGDFKFKSVVELENIYSKLNLEKNDPLILYCHSGVRSAHTTFVMTQLLGYKNVKNYDGSWVEWSHDDNLPYELD